MLIENLAEDRDAHSGMAYNFGTDDPVSALEMVENILNIAGDNNVKPIIQNAASNEIQDQYLSSKLAEERLGWKAEYSLQDGLRETFEWYSAFLSQK